MSAYDTKWWGWGDVAKRVPLGEGALEFLATELGAGDRRTPPVALDDVRLPAPQPLPPALARIVGERGVLTGDEDRLRRAAGKSYPDLFRLRSGQLEDAPDAVVLPADRDQVRAVLEACAAERVAVVPFGGGTSVVGGVDPIRGGFDRLISLDLERMRSVETDPRSLVATLGPGLRGPAAEAELGARGLTLGHFPQSFEYATIGGFAATRSAGQASSGYGRFDDVVTSLRMVAPAGELATLEVPHTAAGPSLRELIVGSEGVLGVITDVSVRVRPQPQARLYIAWMVASFADGAELMRSLAQAGALPDIARVSDEEETRVSMALSGPRGAARRAMELYLKARRREGGCLVITGFEGDREDVSRRRAIAERLIRAGGGVPLGRRAGAAWERGRYTGPYLRDELLDRGVFVETLETAHTWSRLDELYRGVGEALRGALTSDGGPSLVMCHISHVYRDGASLYFTFFAPRREGAELEQWREAKTAACEAIVRHGGTITHHHAVGRDHALYMESEVGGLGVEVLRAAKERLDPAGIMNPGKLIPTGASSASRPGAPG
jgi:alkyldihydroxyacetonephosphate synthase